MLLTSTVVISFIFSASPTKQTIWLDKLKQFVRCIIHVWISPWHQSLKRCILNLYFKTGKNPSLSTLQLVQNRAFNNQWAKKSLSECNSLFVSAYIIFYVFNTEMQIWCQNFWDSSLPIWNNPEHLKFSNISSTHQEKNCFSFLGNLIM